MSQTFLQLYHVMTCEWWNHISTWTHYFIFTTHKLSLSKFWQSCGKVCDTNLTQKLLHIVNTFRRSNSIAAKSCESVNQDIESAISLVTCKYCPIKIFAIKKKLRRGKNYIYICKHCFFLHPSRPWMLNLLGIPRNLFILFFSIILVLEPNVQLHFNQTYWINMPLLFRYWVSNEESLGSRNLERVITHRHPHTRCLWHTEYAWHQK